jgi:hypothetical protein
LAVLEAEEMIRIMIFMKVDRTFRLVFFHFSILERKVDKMGRKNKSNVSIFDRVFAITVVCLMCVIILSVPFLMFYAMMMYVISLTPDVRINSTGMFSSIKIILKFFVATVFITWIVDTFFSIVLHRSSRLFGILLEGILMFAFFYLYILAYSLVSNEITIKDNGCFYISSGLFLLYLSIHLMYSGTKKLYKVTAKK